MKSILLRVGGLFALLACAVQAQNEAEFLLERQGFGLYRAAVGQLEDGRVDTPIAFSEVLPAGVYDLVVLLDAGATGWNRAPWPLRTSRADAEWGVVIAAPGVVIEEVDCATTGVVNSIENIFIPRTIEDFVGVCSATPWTYASAAQAAVGGLATGSSWTDGSVGVSTCSGEAWVQAEVQMSGVQWTLTTNYVDLSRHYRFELTAPSQVTISGALSIDQSAGSSARFPVEPDQGETGFTAAESDSWFVGPASGGLEFQTEDGFTWFDWPRAGIHADADGIRVQIGDVWHGSFSTNGIDLAVLNGGVAPKSFRIVGIDTLLPSGALRPLPFLLRFESPTADFSVRPHHMRWVGQSCSPATGCETCHGLSLDMSGSPVLGDSSFELSIRNAANFSVGLFFVQVGIRQPLPFDCDAFPLSSLPLYVGSVSLTGWDGLGCGASGSFALPLPANRPGLVGLELQFQAAVRCVGGGFAFTNGVEIVLRD